MRRFLLIILPLILAFPLGAIRAQDRLTVVATTTILADVAQNVAGDLVDVVALIPADTDPHAFEPSTAHAALIARADLILAVGASYEAFLGDLLATVGEAVPVVIVSEGVMILPYGDEAEPLGILGEDVECDVHAEDEADGEHEHEGCDPHVWQDPTNVGTWLNNLRFAFAELDPDHVETYNQNAQTYDAELNRLIVDLREQVDAIPLERRTLITNHDFMSYYARAFGFQIVATVLPGGATGTEIAPRDLAALIDLVETAGVPAVFAENTTTPQLADLVAGEAGVKVVTLYSDALSEAAPTYIDMMRANTAAIVEALQ